MPIEGVVLQMKSMHIDAVANFPFPTPPDRLTLRKAETVLTHLGALAVSAISKGGQVIDNATIGGQITDLGRAMSLFPLSPRFSRMLVSGRQQGCLPYVIAIVSALSVGDPFLREEALSGDAEEATAEDDSPTQDTAHTNSETVRANEEPRTRRKAYFQAQQVMVALIARFMVLTR
jgi:ATP-dependent RNA helicase DHX37/DHR1